MVHDFGVPGMIYVVSYFYRVDRQEVHLSFPSKLARFLRIKIL